MNKRLFIFIVLATALLSIPRFAHQTPDSEFYIETAEFFRGNFSYNELLPPYAYRVLLPFLAAYGPTSQIDFNFAIINVISTILAYSIFYYFLKSLYKKEAEVVFGIIILVVSFPTVNYSSGVLTDPIGFLVFVIATYFFLNEKKLLFSLTASLGVLAREANLSLVLAMLIYTTFFDHGTWRSKASLILTGLPPILTYFGIRLFFSNLPGYVWLPSFDIVWQNLTSPVSWMTFLLVILPPMIMIAIGMICKKPAITNLIKISDRNISVLFSWTIACTLLIIYSVLSAFMSGRFAWPLYIALVPAAVTSMQNLPFFDKVIVPIIEKIFDLRDQRFSKTT